MLVGKIGRRFMTLFLLLSWGSGWIENSHVLRAIWHKKLEFWAFLGCK